MKRQANRNTSKPDQNKKEPFKIIDGKGLYYDPQFVSPTEKSEILKYLKTIYPIWEERYSPNNPPPEGQQQRSLLRPVYWLGNWQFACLNYYHPPKGIYNRCVEAERFPPILQRLVDKVEMLVREKFVPGDIPRQWHLNTCLINYYGSKIEGDKKIDVARVGEHKDFEPGPVASISLGERAFFQFVSSQKIGERDEVVFQQWLDDCSLQIFAGHKFKDKLFHRVQRVDTKLGIKFDLNTTQFETRRINFTFRYVPTDHIVDLNKLPVEQKQDILPYVKQLAIHSTYFAQQLS